ncbi:helix-turn-helix domain-containing protein [Actinopolymorpha alba]|uniref:helix-turn-helix domain-containing protein n=1 Tax=Actinopolymorpha alba TaxID=533267 RepID=UPI0003823447|nr:helix-turn-helix domain-containing protein [Actinopolymorpha alba]
MESGLLTSAGVSSTEEKAYTSLLRDGPATRGELADRLGLSGSRVAQLVGELQRKGLAHRTPPPHEAYVAVPPHVAVAQLIERRHDELSRVRDSVNILAALARPEPTRRRTEELIEIVQGRAAVQHAFDRVQRAARTEVLVLDAPPYAGSHTDLNDVEVSLLSSGITYRGVYAEEALATPELVASIAEHLLAGEQARLAATVPIKLAVADRKLALLPLSWSDAAQDTAVLVHPCGLLDALIALFESVWNAASPLVVTPEHQVEAPGEISDVDRQLLSLLVAGMTDEAVGARLRISRRTVVRRVHHLMSVGGARSRLQLGWRAKELGWL